MMTLHDLEGTRRSLAMAPLSRDEADRVLDTCTALLRERQQIVDLLDRALRDVITKQPPASSR